MNLTVQIIRNKVSRHGDLPLVAIGQEFFFIIEELFVSFSGKLVIRTLHNGVYRTSLLAKPTINAFGHVDIVTSSFPAPVSARFGFNRDGLCRTNSLAEFTGDAALFTTLI